MAVKTVMVKNRDNRVLHRVSVKHAFTMVSRGVAEIIEVEEEKTFGTRPYPKVLLLARYVFIKFVHQSNGPRWTRKGVHARDGRCGYCLTTKTGTVDHIVPSSRGGKSEWLNTVSCCLRCNQKKANRTPAEAGMELLITPFVPTWEDVPA